MTANKHTPGPWHHEATNSAHMSYVVVSADGIANGSTVVIGQCAGPDRLENARLIAAAPDSCAANVMFVESMNQFCGITPDWDDDRIYDELPSSQLAQAYFAARAAIAKAGGAA